MAGLSKLQNALLTVGAVLGTLCLVLALAGVLLGVKPLMFRSGSMVPAIGTGALGISVPVDGRSIRPADVVSVHNAAGVRVIHRVVRSDVQGEATRLTLKGDANNVADSEPYVVDQADKVLFSVPALGYVIAWLSTPAATFLGGLLSAYLLFLAFRQTGDKPGRKRGSGRRSASGRDGSALRAPEPFRVRRGERTRRAGLTAAAAVVLASGALTGLPPARAAFIDTGAAGPINLTASTLPAPTLTCQQRDVLLILPDAGTVDLTWSDNHGAMGVTGYRFTIQTGTGPASSPQNYQPNQTTRSVTANQISSNTPVTITFSLYSRYQLWTSPVATATARYEPESMGGLMPATLQC